MTNEQKKIIRQHVLKHPERTYDRLARELGISKQTLVRVVVESNIRRPRGPKLRLRVQ